MRFLINLTVMLSIFMMGCAHPARKALSPEGRDYFRDLSKLCSFSPRNAGTLNERQAGRWLMSRLRDANYTVVTQAFPIGASYVESLNFRVEGINRNIPVGVALYSGSVTGRFEITDQAEDCSNKILLLSKEKAFALGDSVSAKPPALILSYSSDYQFPFGSLCGYYSGGRDPETARRTNIVRYPMISAGYKDAMAIAGMLGKGKAYAKIKLKTRTVDSYSFNVIAFNRQFDRSKKYICLCAHYDSVLGPAANDNGSGTILVLKLAEYFQGRNENVLYAFTGSEETGLVGAWRFVDRFIGPDQRPYCAINFSSILEGGVAIGNTGSGNVPSPDFLVKSCEALLIGLSIPYYTYSIRPLSDDFMFNLRGIPAMIFGGSTQTYHHSITDYPRHYDYLTAGLIKKSAIGFITNTLAAGESTVKAGK